MLRAGSGGSWLSGVLNLWPLRRVTNLCSLSLRRLRDSVGLSCPTTAGTAELLASRRLAWASEKVDVACELIDTRLRLGIYPCRTGGVIGFESSHNDLISCV